MKKFFKEEFDKIESAITDTTILFVEHNENADEGLIITLDNGIVLTIGFSSGTGSIEMKQVSLIATYYKETI